MVGPVFQCYLSCPSPSLLHSDSRILTISLHSHAWEIKRISWYVYPMTFDSLANHSSKFPLLLTISLNRFWLVRITIGHVSLVLLRKPFWKNISSTNVFVFLWCRQWFIWKQMVCMSNKTILYNQSVGMRLLWVLTKSGTNFVLVTTFENESSWERSSYGQSKQLNNWL